MGVNVREALRRSLIVILALVVCSSFIAFESSTASAKSKSNYRLIKTVKIYAGKATKDNLVMQYSFKYNKRNDPCRIIIRDYDGNTETTIHYLRYKYYKNGKRKKMIFGDLSYPSIFEYDKKGRLKIGDKESYFYYRYTYKNGYINKQIIGLLDEETGQWDETVSLRYYVSKYKNGYPKRIRIDQGDKSFICSYFNKRGLLKKDVFENSWCKTKYKYNKKGLIKTIERQARDAGGAKSSRTYKVEYTKRRISRKRYTFMFNTILTGYDQMSKTYQLMLPWC